MTYFTLRELTRSALASRRKINNVPSPHAIAAMMRLTDNLLDPVRELWGQPLKVNSGYRSEALNAAVGGSHTSHHLRGMAADITAGNPTDNSRLFQLILASGLPFTQLIDEKNYRWLHLSYDPADLRKEVLHL